MPFLKLKPDWPNTFRRTVQVGKRSKRLAFPVGEAIEVTQRELEALGSDVGNALCHVEQDEKGRFRYVEPTDESSEPATDEGRELVKAGQDVSDV